MDHLRNFFGTVDKLDEMEILIAEDLLDILLLYSILDTYENFRCAIEARNELSTLEALKIKLKEEYNARIEKDIQKEQYSQDAFHAKSAGNEMSHKSTQKIRKRKPVCQVVVRTIGVGQIYKEQTTSAIFVTK